MKQLKQVDHVGIESDNPRRLFEFFSETLGLPIVFDYAEYPSYTSGSVSLGNMFLEFMRFGAPKQTRDIHSHYLILGFLTESNMMLDCLQELDDKNILHSAVIPFFSPEATDANQIRLWDNVYIGHLLGNNIWQRLFLRMSYHMTPKPSMQQSALLRAIVLKWLSTSFRHGMPVLTQYHQYVDTHRKAIDGSMLESAQGGKMHIKSVAEIVIGVSPIEEKFWTAFFDSHIPITNNLYTLPHGPNIHFVPDKNPGIKTLILKCQSLQHVCEVAEAEKLDYKILNDRLQLNIPGNITFELTE